MGDFRVGVGAPRNDQSTGPFLRAGEEGVLNHGSRGGVCGVGEFEWQANVAGCVDLRVGGPKEIVLSDAATVVLDARRFEIETLDVGLCGQRQPGFRRR